MQDSLELPQQLDSVHTLLSPPQMRQSRENTPPHSLAYSNSTCAKDRMQDIQIRSPLMFEQLQGDSPSKFGVIKANNQNYPINIHKTVPVSPNQKQALCQLSKPSYDKAAVKGKYKKIKPKLSKDFRSPQKSEHLSPNLNQLNDKKHFNATQPVQTTSAQKMQQRKTLDKTGHNSGKRVKQLQQALHMENVLSEQLRTKLSISNSLLESKLKEIDLGYFFSLKNSSREMKNIDIYVELTNTRKILNEKNIIIDRLKDQFRESNFQMQKLKLKKGGSPIVRSPNRTLNDQIEKLLEQKESLMSYIDEQKLTLKKKIEYIAQLEQEVNRLNNKSGHYTDIERPKLISQLSQLKMKNKQLQELTETMRMQFNLEQLKIFSENQQLKTKIDKLQQVLMKQDALLLSTEQKPRQSPQTKSVEVQKEDVQYKIMLDELTRLKKERDYYHSQYHKRTEDSAKLYTLQLKLSIMEQPTHSLH